MSHGPMGDQRGGDPLDRWADRAALAVRERAEARPADVDVADVERRARRSGTSLALALLLLAVVSVPAVLWLGGSGSSQVEFAPATPPPTVAPEPEAEPEVEVEAPTPAPEPAPDPTPAPDPAPSPDPAPTAEPAPDPDPDPEPEPSPTLAPIGVPSTDARSSPDFPFDGAGFAQLVDVRVATHPDFDRIVLEFSTDDIPGYRVGYVDPPIIQDGSGEPVQIDGSAFLEIHLTPASGATTETDAPEGWELTYDGPLQLRLDSGTVTEVVRVDDWEANLSWVVGVERRAPFSMEWLDSPRRLVVDVQRR